MATHEALTANGYIGHHLTFLAKPVGNGSFWTVHVDTLVVSALLGILAFWIFNRVARKATSGVPGKLQAFIELVVEFVDNQVKDVFHGDRKFIAPLSLTVFVWVLLMNAMDFIPADIIDQWIVRPLGGHEWRAVPTADVNTTFALSLSVFAMVIFYSIKVKGLGGWIHELFYSPFGANPLLWPFNFLFNMIEYLSKPLSHSLRLYGNMYAGEIIFLLLALWASTGVVGVLFGGVLSIGWAIFHILIVVLQAYIFMMLTIVYISMAHEHH